MNRRNFIKGCILGSVAMTVPLIAAPVKVKSLRLNLATNDLSIGDYIQVPIYRQFELEEIGKSNPRFTVSEYGTYMHVGNNEFIEVSS